MPNIAFDSLSEFATSLLRAGGASEEEANTVGPSLATANLRGYSSHGMMRIPFYLNMLNQLRGSTTPNIQVSLCDMVIAQIHCLFSGIFKTC